MIVIWMNLWDIIVREVSQTEGILYSLTWVDPEEDDLIEDESRMVTNRG